ncbi:MAG TPA: hypothetical protein VFG05_03930, partial [Methylocella sp.]|nr:hypothetical protein [Methylocella sp.]
RAPAATPLRRQPAQRVAAEPMAAAAKAAEDAAFGLPSVEMPLSPAAPDLESLPSRQDQERQSAAAGGPSGASPPAGQEKAPKTGIAVTNPSPGDEGSLEEQMARFLGR